MHSHAQAAGVCRDWRAESGGANYVVERHLGGTIFVEQIFDYPGMGQLMFDALGNRDYPLMQAIFLLMTVGVLTANFLADMLYGVIDPRVRRGGEH